jgi:membrane associated rhomboid family serine protease
MTYGILVVNVVAFLYAKLLGSTGFGAATSSWGTIPFEITHGVDAISPTPFPVYATLVTSMFMHAGWMHIGLNMLYLWVFANNVEDVLGRVRFLVFYLLCGVASACAQVLADPESTIPLVGASGAVAGALGAYLVAFPGASVHVLVPIFFFIRIVPVPAVVVLLMWFGFQLLNVWLDQGGAGGGVAWYAHIGGFVAGYLMMRIGMPPNRRRRVET